MHAVEVGHKKNISHIFALYITSAFLCWAGQTQTTRKFDTCVCFICYLCCLKFIYMTHNEGHPVKKRKTVRLEKHDPKVVWTPSSSWCPHRQKWMDSFWTRGEESCHCHLVYAVSDAAVWTWGWGINLHPWASLDILFPDGASPAVDSAPKGPGISARPIHHRRTSPYTGNGGPSREHLPSCFHLCG